MYGSTSEGQTGLGLAHDSQRERGRLGAAPTAAAAGSALGDYGVFDGDGKRVRRPLHRRTVDYTSTAVRYVQTRVWQRDVRDSTILQPTPIASVDMLPTVAYTDNPASSFATKFVHASTNKVKYSINRVLWIPTGRRLITGLQSGEFTLWNGQSFNFEMILQAHDEAIRSMVWSHNENWMVTGDDGGCIKYWQSNMNNVKANKTAHKEAVRDLSFSSTDLKFCSCSDDTTVKVWDFARCQEERSLAGHGWDVKSVDWHPQKSILVSGAKDSLVKLWDAKTGRELCTLHGHKNIVLSVKWNKNGNWILTASKDQIIKLYDIRTLKELESYRGHRKDVTCLAWHPFHEELFVSGSYDGTIMHWLVGHEVPQAEVANAHDSSVWDLCWHPMGHILCSGSNDHTTKFWCRNRPGDTFRDKHGTAHSHGTSGDQTLLASGRPASSVQAMEGPTTPGAFASGGPVRGEGSIPGVGMAMPLAQPSIDSGVTAESTMPQSILGEFIPSGTIPRGPHPPSAPHPSTISSGQPVYQQLQMQQQQQPLQQSQQPEQPQQQLPPHLLQQQVHLPLPPPLQPIGIPMQQQPSHAIPSLGAPPSISSSEPLLSRPMVPQSSAALLIGGQVASIVPLSGPAPQIRSQLGPALGVPSMRPVTGQLPIPSQGLSQGSEFLGTVHSGQMPLSGGQAFSFGGLQAPIPGLMASLGGAPYSGLPGPPLPAAMTTGPHSFQGGPLPTMMDVRALGINVALPMGMGLNVPPHSHGPGPPQQ